MTFPHYMDDRKLYVPFTGWNALKVHRDEQPFCDMIEAAKEVIRTGGAFIVYRESDTSIMLRCDRLSELEDAIDES